MKKLLLIITIAWAAISAQAQDIFQQKLYSPELILKYRDEAGLSADQVDKIKNIYNTELPAYNNKKWDLDAAMTRLEQLISQSSVDSKAANTQLDKALVLETEIKKMKLSTLIKIKNLLTPAQQTKLDAHKGEAIADSSITAFLNDNQRAVVRIRQTGELDVNGKPLFIVINGTEKREFDEMPKGIDPADIESMEVLTNGDAAKIYGKRGENGVIIITYKRR